MTQLSPTGVIEWKILNLLTKHNFILEIDALKPDFFHDERRTLFEIIYSLFADAGVLPSDDILQVKSGIPFIEIDIGQEPTKSLFRELVKLLREEHEKELIQSVVNGMQPSDSLSDLKGKINTLIEGLSTEQVEEFILEKKLQETIDTLMNNEPRIGIPTGVSELDHITGGFFLGSFDVIAGRPSMGKSSLAIQMMVKNSYEGNNTTLMFSQEDSTENILLRCMANITGVNYSRLHRHLLDEADKTNIMQIQDKFRKAKMLINDNPMTADEIALITRKMKVRNPSLNLVIVDYLQLLMGDGDDFEITTQSSKKLKRLAKEINVNVIGVSQLNRKVEDRLEKRPTMSDLKMSGGIEQDADRVLMLYRPYYYSHDQAESNICEFLLRKNRHGEVKDIIGECFMECLQFG